MQRIISSIVAVGSLILLIVGSGKAESPGDFNIRFGVGYDLISQQYFIDSLRVVGADSAVALSLLSKDYLDDKKAVVYFKYDRKSEGRKFIELGWEQTPQLFRIKGWGHLRLDDKKNRLDCDINIDSKKRYRGDVEEGEEFSVLEGRLKYKRKFSDSFESSLKINGENITFDSTGLLVYNYSKIGAELEINFLSHNYNSFYMTAGFERGDVPDSTALEYGLFRGRLGYMGTIFGSRLMTELESESKSYHNSNVRDDYNLSSLSVDLRISLAPVWSLNPGFNLEYFNFKTEKYFSYDYLQLRSELILELQKDRFTFGLGPKFSGLEIETDYLDDDDYREYLISLGIDFFSPNQIFMMMENQIGQRDYINEPDFYSDFIFYRLSLIGSMKIMDKLTLDMMTSAEWEFHKVSSDDSRLYLLSGSLIYSL